MQRINNKKTFENLANIANLLEFHAEIYVKPAEMPTTVKGNNALQIDELKDRRTDENIKKTLFSIYIPCKRLSVYKGKASLKSTIIFDTPIHIYV